MTTWGDGTLMPDSYFEDDIQGTPEELEAFVTAVHGDNQIVDDNGVVWGIVGSRHGMSAYVRVRERRQLRAPFRFIRDWWRGAVIVVLFVAILAVGGVR